jgi:hypothetical protein
MARRLFEFKSWNRNEMEEDGTGVWIGVLERIWLCLRACKEPFGFKSIYKWFMYVFRFVISYICLCEL